MSKPKLKIDVESVGGHRYFLTIVEEARRYTAVFPTVNKAKTSGLLLRFVSIFENKSGYSIKAIQSDNGTEFRREFDELGRKEVDLSKTTV